MLTGIPSLDSLVGPTPRWWIAEFYGDWKVTTHIAHHAVASASARGLVAVVHVQEFGGLNPYTLARLSKLYGGTPDNVLIARAFRLVDVPGLIDEAVSTGAETIVVYDPYLYAPRSPTRYQNLTPVTSAIRRASSKARVLVFNRTGLGRWRPEGGGFHHHTVHVMVRLSAWRGGARAVLVKHPARRVPASTLIPGRELVVGLAWGGQCPLTEYL